MARGPVGGVEADGRLGRRMGMGPQRRRVADSAQSGLLFRVAPGARLRWSLDRNQSAVSSHAQVPSPPLACTRYLLVQQASKMLPARQPLG